MNNMKKISALVLGLVTALVIAMSAMAGGTYVFDQAGLLSDGEISALNDRCASLSEKMNMDYVIVTTADKGGKSLAAFADDFYDYNGFGGAAGGACFVLDMQDRTCYVSTYGDMIAYLNDDRIYAFTGDAYGNGGDDDMWDHLSHGNYYTALSRSADITEYYYDQGIPGKKKDGIGAIILKLLGSLGAAAGISAGRISSIKNKYAMKTEKAAASGFIKSYMATSAFNYSDVADQLLSTHTTTRIIPRSTGGGGGSHSGSTTHTSSSGRTHGGGGGGRHF